MFSPLCMSKSSPNSMKEPGKVVAENGDSDSGYNFSFISVVSQDQDQESPTDDFQHQESDFEFGCVKPSYPANDPNKSSPADVLFFNGRLLPHAFPSKSAKNGSIGHSQVSSRTSSVSSKDSLLSSRSNSRSSSGSSGRTSSSENIEKRLLSIENSNETGSRRLTRERNQMNRSIRLQSQVSNQRWQFIAPAPTLTPTDSVSRLKRAEILVPEDLRYNKQVRNKNKKSSWFGGRFFWSFVSTCRACHALEPSQRKPEWRENF